MNRDAIPELQQQPQELEALIRLWVLAQRDHGGARIAAKLLLALYNGDRFPFPMYELRGLDRSYQDDAFAVMRMDAYNCQKEVHSWLNSIYGRRDFGARFEQLAHNWRLKGRCKKEFLTAVEPVGFDHE